jgi:hypothetical protein
LLLYAVVFDGGDPQRPMSVAVKLTLREEPAASWSLALLPGQDPARLEERGFFGFPVDGGEASLIDAQYLRELNEEGTLREFVEDAAADLDFGGLMAVTGDESGREVVMSRLAVGMASTRPGSAAPPTVSSPASSSTSWRWTPPPADQCPTATPLPQSTGERSRSATTGRLPTPPAGHLRRGPDQDPQLRRQMVAGEHEGGQAGVALQHHQVAAKAGGDKDQRWEPGAVDDRLRHLQSLVGEFVVV